jgi:hypothetical protein
MDEANAAAKERTQRAGGQRRPRIAFGDQREYSARQKGTQRNVNGLAR